MREFKLYNSLGTEWNLNTTSSFLQDPAGLGQEHDTKYEQVGTAFVETQDDLKQKKIKGKLKLSGYDLYLQFVKFIQYTPLTLEYTAAETFFIQAEVTKLEKSELETGGLICPIEITGTDTWYKRIVVENEVTEQGKQYPYTYTYKYYDQASGQVVIESDSILESPVKIMIKGPCTNPQWVLYQNGVQKSSGKVFIEIAEGQKLIVDTTKVPYSIALTDTNNNFIEDEYQNSDFSTKRFIKLGAGENKLNFSQAGNEPIKINVEGRIEYETV